MTLPDERYRSVVYAEKFLQRLAGGEYPRVPKAVREEARMLLRHYPSQYYMDQVADQMPGIIAKTVDPLYKMVHCYPKE
jgi:hypothetical protein